MITQTETPPTRAASEGSNRIVSPDDTPSPRDAQGPSPPEGLIGLDTIEGADRVYVVQTRETQALFAGLGLPCVCPPRPGVDCDPLPLAKRRVVLLRDRTEDPDGLHGIAKYAHVVTTACTEIAIDLVGLVRDVRDMPQTIETGRLVRRLIDAETNHGRPIRGAMWRRPQPIGSALPEVPPFPVQALPDAFRDWIGDAAYRMDVPLDFMAVTALCSAGAVIGRQCGIHPKAGDSWIVVPNLWGICVGPPSLGKSPAMREALAGIRALEADAAQANAEARAAFDTEAIIAQAAADAAERALKRNPAAPNARELAATIAAARSEAPEPKRYRTADPTVEALSELLQRNPNGLLLLRDELLAWLCALERTGREGDRAWFLESWDGTDRSSFDRIGRGSGAFNHCVAILGNMTPGQLRRYVAEATGGSHGADGLLQRFQLAVYPNASPPEYRDGRIDSEAQRVYVEAFRRLADLNPNTGDGPIPALRFAADAQDVYRRWWEANAKRSRDPALSEALQAHFGKYPSLAPALALIFELVSGGRECVGLDSLKRALKVTRYLEPHAMRIYSLGSDATDPAAALGRRIEAGDLESGFTVRDVRRHGWRGLTTTDSIQAGLDRLEAAHWVRGAHETTGGRPTVRYQINPAYCGDVSDV